MSTLGRDLVLPHDVASLQAMLDAIPYARYLGIGLQLDGADIVLRMPFREDLVGNARLQAVHGGALGALLEFAAICQLMSVAEVKSFPKIVNITMEYLRGAQPPLDTFARATVTRHGRRVANVRAIAYQADASKPITAANAHFLLSV